MLRHAQHRLRDASSDLRELAELVLSLSKEASASIGGDGLFDNKLLSLILRRLANYSTRHRFHFEKFSCGGRW